MKRKIPPTTDNDSPEPEAGISRRDGNPSNTNLQAVNVNRSSRVSRQEVNFEELPYDLA